MIHLLWLTLAIPIIIHLVYRRKAKPMPFSTLYFLKRIDQRVARRQKLRELLLLALRILVLAALIGALEKPMWRSATFKGSTVPRTAAIVLDNTASMLAVHQGSTAFARAQAAAMQVLDGLKSEDSAVLCLFDSHEEGTSQPTTALAELRAQISKMECGYGSADLSGALRRAARSLQLSTNPAKEIYVLTDMQRPAWTGSVKEAAALVPGDVPVFLVDVGANVSRNLTIRDANTGLKANVVGAIANIYAVVENTAAQNATAKVALFIDGRKVGEQSVSVSPGATQTVVFKHTFEQAGGFGAYVEIEPDELCADNRRHFVVQVLEKLPVLIVNGDPSVIPYRDGAFFLKLALHGSIQQRRLSPIEAHVIEEKDLAAATLEEYGCVILANVSRVDDKAAQALRRYVQSGGGLLIFCGDKVDAAAYNLSLGQSEGNQPALLPAPLAERRSAPAEKDGFLRIQRIDSSHPIFRDVISEEDLRTARVKSFLIAEMDKAEKGALALMEMDDGPLMLEKKLGAGSVIFCATSCTPAWSNLPLKPYFLPLAHQTVYYLSRSGGHHPSTQVGMAYHLDVTGTLDPVEVRFFMPDAKQSETQKTVRSMPRQGVNRATLQGLERPGVYRAEYTVGGQTHRRLFAVNVAVEESVLTRLPLDKARDELGVKNLVLVREPDKLTAAVRIERQGLPLWDYLLLATLIVAVCEGFVGNVVLKH